MVRRNKNQKRFITFDSFINHATNMGLGAKNPLSYTQYIAQNITINYEFLCNLYQSNWIAQRIVNVIPEDMMTKGYNFNTQLTPQILNKISRLESKLQLNEKIIQGLQYARLFGGAGALILLNNQDNLEEPLDLNSIMPDDFKGLLIFDGRQECLPSGELIDDINSLEFNKPKYYLLNSSNSMNVSQIKVHHSRIIRFEGRMVTPIQRAMYNFWGASEFEHIFEEIVKKDNVSWNIAGLTQKANISVLKLFGLDTIATTTPLGRSNLKSRLEATNMIMNNQGLLVLGESDEFQNFQYGFAGLGECYDRFMMDISGASEIPVTKLFGRSPAGMNATGESDLSNYYEMIARRQESILRPIYDKLFPILFLSVCGFIPDDLDYDFNPLRIPTEEEKSNLTTQYTNNIIQAYQAGLITQKTAIKELSQLTELTGAFSNITDEEINRAKEEFFTSQGEEPNPFAGMNQEQQEEDKEEVPF